MKYRNIFLGIVAALIIGVTGYVFAFGSGAETSPVKTVTSAKVTDVPEGMVLIKGGVFDMGGDGNQAEANELPKHKVQVRSFLIDETAVTNGEFRKFVEETGYVTTAEQKPNWEELKKGLPEGTPKPPEEVLQPGALVFKKTEGPVNLNDYSNWWEWTIGADWRHPEGPESSIKGKDDYPVVQVSYKDARAYAQWAEKELPTEAQWEYAARGGLNNNLYAWGNEHPEEGDAKANTWEGHDFPYHVDHQHDGYAGLAPVKQYEANGYGLYDSSGNVWEWTLDYYDADYYKRLQGGITKDPKGPDKSSDPMEPGAVKRTVRGGSFLCNDAYCSGYRVARRMPADPDTGLNNTGFRCVKNIVRE